MGNRVDRHGPPTAQLDTPEEPAGAPGPEKTRASVKPKPAPAPAKGVAKLVKSALPSPFFTFQKQPATARPARPVGDEAAIRQALEQQSGLTVESKPKPDRIDFAAPPPAPRKAKVKLMTSALEPDAPVALRFEAQKRMQALEATHDKTRVQLERSVAHWTEAAARLQTLAKADARQGVFREGLDGAVWSAELNASTAKALLRDLKIDFDAAKVAYEALLGQTRGPSVRRAEPTEPVNMTDAGTTAERFLKRLQRYDQSVEAVKSSGALAPMVGAAKGIAAALHGRDLDADDYRILDGIYLAGQVVNVPLGIIYEQRGLARGAQPTAPGVDHRDEAQNAIRDNLVRARQYGTYDR